MIRLILLALVFGFSMVLGIPSAAANTTDTLKKSMSGDIIPEPIIDQPLTPLDTQEIVDVVVEIMPAFKGGMSALNDYISKKINYPIEPFKKGITGKVLIDFEVDTAGKVSNISCPNADKLHPALIDEAIRVVKLTNGLWTPGRKNGARVKAKMRLPIVFEIE